MPGSWVICGFTLGSHHSSNLIAMIHVIKFATKVKKLIFPSLFVTSINQIFSIFLLIFKYISLGATSSDGFAAVKLTALGRPQMLVGNHQNKWMVFLDRKHPKDCDFVLCS